MPSQQGTGKHGHKDSAEPYPHTRGQSGSQGRQSDQQNRQGRQDSSQGNRQADAGQQQGARGRQSDQSQGRQSGQQSLQQREYKGSDGEIHHHTRSYMERHKDS